MSVVAADAHRGPARGARGPRRPGRARRPRSSWCRRCSTSTARASRASSAHVAERDDGTLADALAGDELVAHLLLLHGLHPVPLEARVRGALDEVRPYLETHGGERRAARRRGRRRAAAAAGQLQRLPVVGDDAQARDRGGDPQGGARRRRRSSPRTRRARALIQLEVYDGVSRRRCTHDDAARGSSPGAATVAREAALERCELCGAPIAPEHRHLLDTERRELHVRLPRRARSCSPPRRRATGHTSWSPDRRLRIETCAGCSVLFASDAASAGHYRLVGDRRLRIEDLELDDVAWEELRLPVEMAFFFHNSAAGRVQAFYPSPMGPTESLLGLEAWTRAGGGQPGARARSRPTSRRCSSTACAARAGTGSCRSTTATRSSA